MAVGALLAAVGALAGHRVNAQPAPRNWDGWLARVAAVATLLLLGAGGLVTSHEAGLAVPDWPNSFSSNMFLYPLSRMTGGIYLEHAHRLFGSLVGLTTAVLTLHLWRVEQRAWVRRLAFAAFALVCLQGLLGGLRVTGGLTLTTDRSVLAPSTTLALVHGVTGQLFFSVLCLLAAAVSTQWRRDDLSDGIDREAARATGTLTGWLVGILVVQLVLGAAVRHFTWGIALHVTGGLTVLLLGILVGVRAWGLHVDRPVLPQLGVALAVLVSLQFLLGMGSYAVTAAEESGGMLAAYQVPVTTIHQTCGAAVLGAAVLLHAWARRALPAEPAAATAAPAVG